MRKWDIVIAPHTLWPLREDYMRKNHLDNLWNLVSDQSGVLVLLEKGVAFEEVLAPPSKEESFLQRSPMGKVPFIEANGSFLAESQAIVEYIEETQPQPPLYPRDPWARAICRRSPLTVWPGP